MSIGATGAAQATATAGEPAQQSKGSADQTLASKDTFLQLLVAQMRNQDPLQPTDSVQFLSQLAQFSNLEQSVQLNQEVIGVRKAVEDLTAIVKTQDSTGETQK